MKTWLAWAMVLVVSFSCLSTTMVLAEPETDQNTITTENDAVSFDSDGGMGYLLANALEEDQANKADEDVSNKILDVTVSGNYATVELNNTVWVKIIVAIYEEETGIMVGSGIGEAAPDEGSLDIYLDVETMPEYFYVKVFILDIDNNPLHESYETIHYTKEFQEFLAQTTDDFDSEDVLNLDEAKNNNFAVFNEETIKIEEGNVNQLVSANDVNRTYTFSNIDSSISSLKQGDIFYYTDDNGNYIIVKVASISVDGTNATIVGEEEVALDEVFSYVKINTESNGAGAEVDTSQMDEGVVYEGVDEGNTSTYGLRSYGSSISEKVSHKWSISKEFLPKADKVSVKVSGSLSFSLGVKFEAYQYDDYFEIGLSIDTKAAFDISVSAKLELVKITLAPINIPLGATGVTVGVDVNFLIEVAAKLSFEASLESTIGVSVNTKGKVEDKSKPAVLETEIQLEGTLFVGLGLEPNVKAFSGLMEVGVSGEAGVEISGKKKEKTAEHLCDYCLEGKVTFVLDFAVEYSINLPFGIEFADEHKFVDFEWMLFDFYYSPDIGWGIGKCPNNHSGESKIIAWDNFGDDNKLKYIVYDNGTLVISGKGKMPLYHAGMGAISPPAWDEYSDVITQIIIEEGITEIGLISTYNIDIIKIPSTVCVFHRAEGFGFGLGKIIVSENNQHFCSDDGVLYNKTKTELLCYPTQKKDTTYSIPDGVTSIESDAINGCSNLTQINIPNSVHYIAWNAIGWGNSLTDVYYEGSEAEWNDILISSTNEGLLNANIHYNSTGSSALTVALNNVQYLSNISEGLYKKEVVENTLIPNENYVLMILKGTEDNYTIDTESLIYITDAVADENGVTEFSYVLDDTNEEYIIKIFGKENAPEYVLGDVNSDDLINAQDALAVLKHAAKISTLTNEQLLAADTSQEGNINASDALQILKYAAKLIDSF